MTRRSWVLATLAGVLAVVTIGVVAWVVTAQPGDPVDVVLEETTCANPQAVLDGAIWETSDLVPWEHWQTQIAGRMVFVDDDSAIFHAEAGFELRYEAVEWSHMDCALLSNPARS